MTDAQAKGLTMQQRQLTFQQARKIFCRELNRDAGLRLAYSSTVSCTLFDRGMRNALRRSGYSYNVATTMCNVLAEEVLKALFQEPEA